jgi:hypothetical protein
MSELIVIAVSIFTTGMGLLGLSSPAAMVNFATNWWQTRSALWAAAAIRLLFGVALWHAAAESRFPAFFDTRYYCGALRLQPAADRHHAFQGDAGVVVHTAACDPAIAESERTGFWADGLKQAIKEGIWNEI